VAGTETRPAPSSAASKTAHLRRTTLQIQRLTNLKRTASVVDIESAISKLSSSLLNVEKEERDSGFNEFEVWFDSHRSGLTFLELRKIWIALFYSYWLSDKYHRQKELALRICSLIHSSPVDNVGTFIGAFYSELQEEWPKLDRCRIEKYNFLARLFLLECLAYIKAHNWGDTALNAVLGSMEYFGPLQNTISHGIAVTIHFLEHYLSALKILLESSDGEINFNDVPEAVTSDNRLPDETMLALLEPFFKIVAETNGGYQRLVEEVHGKVFQKLTGDLICLELVARKLFEIAASGKLNENAAKCTWQSIEALETKLQRKIAFKNSS